MASGSVSRIRCFFKGEYLVKKEYGDKNIEIDSFIEDVEEK